MPLVAVSTLQPKLSRMPTRDFEVDRVVLDQQHARPGDAFEEAAVGTVPAAGAAGSISPSIMARPVRAKPT